MVFLAFPFSIGARLIGTGIFSFTSTLSISEKACVVISQRVDLSYAEKLAF
jgi:hypothetical protein